MIQDPMKVTSLHVIGFVLLLSCQTAIVHAAQAVLVLRRGNGSWQIEDAEKITFNNKDKLRVGSGKSRDLGPDEYRKMSSELILRAGLLRAHSGGFLVRKDGVGWHPVVPDGVSPKGSTSYAQLWSSATISVQKERGSKSATSLRFQELFAILPGGGRSEALTAFLADESNFHGVGEKGPQAAFDERMGLLVAVGASITGEPGARLRQMLLSAMQATDKKLGVGIVHYADLELGLRLVEVSAQTYPNDDAQKKARSVVLAKKEWLEKRVAILKALNAGELWDAFLDKYGEFGRYDSSFQDLQKLREKALRESIAWHLAEGKRLHGLRQYGPSVRELKLVLAREPGNREIKSLLDQVLIEEAATKPPPLADDPNSPTQILLMRYITSAERYIADNRLKEAENEILQGESVVKDDPRILLARAKWLRASGQLREAIDMIDGYERRVPPKEWAAAEALRGEIVHELARSKDNLKAAILKGEAAGDYPAALKAAQSGLKFDGEDLDFLLSAGRNSAIMRHGSEAENLLNKYLRINGPQRDEVFRMLPKIVETVKEPDGVLNWFSGYRSPPGAFYCPISLMPNPRVSEVKGSRKHSTAFVWSGEWLQAVKVVSGQPAGKDLSFFFDYFGEPKRVRRVAAEPIPANKEPPASARLTGAGPVGEGTGVYTAMLNHPVADPLMVEKLTGKRVAAIVAGNPYFHPFAWDGIYLFIAEYDSQGRVKSARQIPVAHDSQAAQTLHTFDFQWDGYRLTEIVERETGTYRRAMSYANGKLASEAISYKGGRGKIEYKYKGDRLTEAECNDDPSLDGRSRHVVFR